VDDMIDKLWTRDSMNKGEIYITNADLQTSIKVWNPGKEGARSCLNNIRLFDHVLSGVV
jgi:hypothetical protein